MQATPSSLLSKLDRAATAIRNGQLDGYVTAKQMKDDDRAAQLSWGPAMRR